MKSAEEILAQYEDNHKHHFDISDRILILQVMESYLSEYKQQEGFDKVIEKMPKHKDKKIKFTSFCGNCTKPLVNRNGKYQCINPECKF